MTEGLAKVRFELDASDWHGHGSETLWAKPIAVNERRVFEIRNSPFFAKGINNLDVVLAKPTENDLVFDFIEVIERLGHSTYMLLMEPAETRVASFWGLLERLGCSYESTHINLSIGRRLLYSVDVPPTADLYEVYEIVEQGRDKGVWMFQAGYVGISESRPKS
jgi:uncharacterized protein DUF4265